MSIFYANGLEIIEKLTLIPILLSISEQKRMSMLEFLNTFWYFFTQKKFS